MKRILGFAIVVSLFVLTGIVNAQDEPVWHPIPTVAVDNTDIVVSWDRVSGATSYDLWTWTKKDGWVNLGWYSETSYRHTGLTPGETYWYAIRAISNFSDFVSAQAPGGDSHPTATATPTSTSTSEPMAAFTPTPTPEYDIVDTPENRCSPYNPNDYSYPQSVEADIVAGMGGRIYGPYTGTYFSSTRETDIEHIVARSEAHDSGLCSATVAERRAFASDLVNLTLASPSVNRNQKGAKDLAEWLPPLNQCWYVNQVVIVKLKYNLTFDTAELKKVSEVLDGCESHDMIFTDPPAPTPTATETPTLETDALTPTPTPTVNALAMWDSNGNGRITCAEAREHGIPTPINSDHPAYPYMDDRDGDGMVCE